MTKGIKFAAHLHKNVPSDWYYQSIKPSLAWYWPLQRYWHKRRFDEVSNLVEKERGKILDIGSADGVFTKVILKKTGALKLIGIDVLKKSVDWANSHWRNHRLEFRVGDAHDLKFSSGTFDAVFANEVLEHVEDPGRVLKEVKRVLKKGGYGVFLVPSDSLLFRSLWDNFWTKTRGKIWGDTHIQTYRDNYLVHLSKKAGFNVEKNHKFLLGMLQVVKVRKI